MHLSVAKESFMTTQAVAHSWITTHTSHDCMRKKVREPGRAPPRARGTFQVADWWVCCCPCDITEGRGTRDDDREGGRSLPAHQEGECSLYLHSSTASGAISLCPCGYTFPFRSQLPASVLWPFKLELFTVLQIRKATLTRKGSIQLRKSEC